MAQTVIYVLQWRCAWQVNLWQADLEAKSLALFVFCSAQWRTSKETSWQCPSSPRASATEWSRSAMSVLCMCTSAWESTPTFANRSAITTRTSFPSTLTETSSQSDGNPSISVKDGGNPHMAWVRCVHFLAVLIRRKQHHTAPHLAL